MIAKVSKIILTIFIMLISKFTYADVGDVYYCNVTFMQIVQGSDGKRIMSQEVDQKFKFKWISEEKIKGNWHWFDRINYFNKISSEKFLASSTSNDSITTLLFDGKYLTITVNSFGYKDSRTDAIRSECDKF